MGRLWGSAGPGFSELPAPGLRIKTDFIGFPGNRTQTGTAGRVFQNCRPPGLRIKTDFIGFPRNRTQTGKAGRAGFFRIACPRFAYQNRFHWVSEESYANREGRPGRVFQNYRPQVCVSKPISLGFRGIVANRRGFGAPPGRVQMKSDAWLLVFPPHASTPFPGLMHERPFFCSMHHFSALPPNISPLIARRR